MDEFQEKALESVAVSGKGVDALAHRFLGLSWEAGAVANRIKKIIRDSGGVISEEDKIYLQEKLGDVLYYLAVGAEITGLSLSDVAKANREKSAALKTSTKDDHVQERTQ